ncbi:hypothetical protein HDU97_004086 [Phlyctochytrium planicorne]|nr:hypothetical protein HDU97_004086 [Phlyctochytrium planicorne]
MLSHYIRTPLPPNAANMIPQYKADWVRLAILMERGGIWLDASIVVTGSLSYIHEKQERNGSQAFVYHLETFTNDYAKPVTESWFIATIAGGAYITAWFQEFNKVFANFNMGDEYLSYLSYQYGEVGYQKILQWNSMPGYLKIHMASQKILEMDGITPPYSEGALTGPLKLLETSGWSDWENAKRLLDPWPKNEKPPLVIKLRGGARWAIMKQLEEPQNVFEGSVYTEHVRGSHKIPNLVVNGLTPLLDSHAPPGAAHDHDHKSHDEKFMEDELKRDH